MAEAAILHQVKCIVCRAAGFHGDRRRRHCFLEPCGCGIQTFGDEVRLSKYVPFVSGLVEFDYGPVVTVDDIDNEIRPHIKAGGRCIPELPKWLRLAGHRIDAQQAGQCAIDDKQVSASCGYG